jgi:hypothetical protein
MGLVFWQEELFKLYKLFVPVFGEFLRAGLH